MRARQRHFLVVLATAVSIALAPSAGPAAAPAAATAAPAVTCPSGTNWDNLLHRCR